MQYMIMLHSEEGGHEDFAPGTPEFAEMMGAWMAYNQMLLEGGHYVDGASLAPSATGTLLKKSTDAASSVTDGPFSEAKEQLGGYYLIEADNLDKAIELAEQVPIDNGTFEIRPVAFRPDPA